MCKEFKPKAKLVGEDGNVFNLVVIARRALIRAWMIEEAKEMQDKVFKSVDYYNALNTIMDYVDVE